MNCRPKLFSEFKSGIRIVNRAGGGIKILCMRDKFVMLESKFKPWNSVETRMTFLKNLYIKEILQKINLSKKIKRPEGFELLGARCLYNDEVLIVCAWKEMVDPNTGEVTKQLTLAGRWRSPAPFKIMMNQVQL